jgi:hypothetical protein
MTSIKDKCFWNLKLLSRNADHLARKLAEVITNKEGKVWYIKESIICMNRSYGSHHNKFTHYLILVVHCLIRSLLHKGHPSFQTRFQMHIFY